MSPTEKELLENLKRKIGDRLPLAQVVLFGSRARGDADPDSDMDVLVVLDGPVDAAADEYVSYCAWEVGFDAGILITTVKVSKHDWEEGPQRSSLLAIAVRREGIPI